MRQILNQRRFYVLAIVALAAVLGWLVVADTTGGVSVVQAGGVVGNGTPQSCTESSLSQALGGGGIVTFNCGSNPTTITLHATQSITKTTTIEGNNLITLDGGNQTQLFATTGVITLTVRNMTLTNGYATSNGAAISGGYRSNLIASGVKFVHNITDYSAAPNLDNGGGAVFVKNGNLQIDNSQFISNTAKSSSGGAILAQSSNVRVTSSLFDSNTSTTPGNGGAFLANGTLGTNSYVILDGDTFTHNQAQGQGGAVFEYLSSAAQSGSYGLINNSSFISNSVTTDPQGGALGGALRIGNGRFIITNSLFNANSSQNQGGAIWTGDTSDIDLANSTISGNNAISPDSTSGYGGGLTISSSGPITLTNDTISNNLADYLGGGIYGGTSSAILKNTIVANNRATNGGNSWNIDQNCGNVLTNGGHNLQYPATSSDPRDHQCAAGITAADPLLAPLADYTGPTKTQTLLANSPARDSGDNAACAASPVNGKDQRGYVRPLGSNCDIGAVEAVPLPTVQAVFSPNAIQSNQTASLTFTFTNISPITLTNVSFTATMPGPVTLTNFTPVNSCQGPGTLTAAPGSSAITLTLAQFNPGVTCSVQLQVTASLGGSYTLNGGPFTSYQTGPGASVTALLQVGGQHLGVSPGGPSGTLDMGAVRLNTSRTLTVTVSNLGNPITSLQISNVRLTGSDTSFSLNAPGSFALSGGTSQSIGITCAPTTGGQHTITLNFSTNDGDYPSVSYNIVCVGAAYIVTNPNDDGQGTLVGSLSYLIKNYAGQGPIGITFDTSAGAINGNVVKLSATVTIPAQVTVDGGCSNGPGIVLQPATGSFNGPAGLKVTGGATLIGLKVTHFPVAQISVAGGGNHFSCIQAVK